jgi:hypothetical protein
MSMRLIRGLAALALAGCAPLQAADPAAPAIAASGVDHVVIVWLKPEFRNDEGRAELIRCGQMLRTIPGLVSLSTGTAVPSDRPIVDDSFDVAFHFKFASLPAMQAYVSHPTHLEFLKKCTSETVERNLIYDSAG